MGVFGQVLYNNGVFVKSEFSGSLGVFPIVCQLENNLYSYIKKVIALEVERTVRYKVMAMLLDFEEKWKTQFQGIVQAWPEFMGGSRHVDLTFDIACVQMQQVRSSMH